MHLHRPFLLITLLNHAGLGPTALCLESSVSPASHIVPRTCHACQFLRDCSHTPLCLEVTFNDLYFFLPIQLHTLSMYSSSLHPLRISYYFSWWDCSVFRFLMTLIFLCALDIGLIILSGQPASLGQGQ